MWYQQLPTTVKSHRASEISIQKGKCLLLPVHFSFFICAVNFSQVLHQVPEVGNCLKIHVFLNECSPLKAIDLALLLKAENKIGMELCKYLHWLPMGNRLAQSCSPGRQWWGNTYCVPPQLLNCCQPGPRFQGKARTAVCQGLVWVTHGDRMVATVCLGLCSPGCCISPMPSEQLPGGSPPSSHLRALTHSPETLLGSPGIVLHYFLLNIYETVSESRVLMKICLSKITQMCTCNATKSTFTETKQLCSFISWCFVKVLLTVVFKSKIEY